MSLLLLFFLLLSTSFLGYAHSPTNSSTILIEGKDGKWILQVRAALTAFENEVHTRYSKGSYKTPEEFKERVIDFLTENIAISFDENKMIDIKNPKVKLGHETVVLFEIEAPDDFKNLIIKNSSFDNIYMSKSALLIAKDGIGKKKFILDQTNNFQVNLVVDGEQLNSVQNTSSHSSLLWPIGLLMIAAFLFFVLKRFKSKAIRIKA